MIGTVASEITLLIDGRFAEQAFDRGQRRLGPDLAALALQTLEQRGLFAADVGASSEPDLEIEAFAAAGDVRAQITAFS